MRNLVSRVCKAWADVAKVLQLKRVLSEVIAVKNFGNRNNIRGKTVSLNLDDEYVSET